MPAHTLLAWAVIFGLGLAWLVIAAKSADPTVLLSTTGFISLLVAILGIRERTTLGAKGAPRSRIESVTARYMGLVWLWGALGLLLVYTLVLSWHEWWHFCLAFACAALLSLGFSAMLGKDAELGREDETMLKAGRILAIAQLVGMIVTIVGLIIDPDKEFLFIKEDDWAGNGIFLFGAMALLLLSAHALLTVKTSARSA